MADLLKGAPVAKAITERLRAETEALSGRGVTPCLAIVRVGEREDDLSYERGAVKRCALAGIAVRNVILPQDVSQDALLTEIKGLNDDSGVHGILLFRPLPKHLCDEAVRLAISPEKDMDGITDGSLAGVFANTKSGYAPCTAQACVELLRHYQIPLTGRRVVILGRSLVIGKPVAMLLMAENATITVCHSRSERLPDICREADILVVAVGRAGMVGAEYVKPGQTVIDVGIHVTEDGGLCGDVRTDEAGAIVSAITPVPGGVGAVTTAILASHVVEAAKRAAP